MLYDYDKVKSLTVSLYVDRDMVNKTYYVSLKTIDGVVYTITPETPTSELYRINDVLKTSVIIGYNLKGNDGKLNEFLNIMQGTPFENNKKDWYTTFVYLDMLEFTKHPVLVGASIGMDINVELDPQHNSEVEHACIFKCLELFKTDIEVKLQFQESDGFDVVKCLKTKTTSLTADAIYNGDESEPERTKFSPKADLLAYFKALLPLSLITMYMSYYDDELRDMLKDKNYVSWFRNAIADNLIQWGLGGAHSIHIKYNIFNKNHERWKGWTLLHIDGDAYYPNIMIKLLTMSRKMNFEKFKKYTEDRAKLKKLNKPSLKMIVLLLKIKVNAMYGLSGSLMSKLFDPSKQFDTVAHGQMIIVALAQQLFNIGGIIFQTNTDGLYVAIPNELRPQIKLIRDYLTTLTGIDFDEDEIDILYQKNVNNYIKVYAPDKDGKRKTEVKGKELCGDYENEYIKSKEFPIVHKAVYDYVMNDVPIPQTIYDTTNHDLSWYISAIFIGNAKSIRLVNFNKITYRGGQYNGQSQVSTINKKSAKVVNYEELYKFKGQVIRILPTKVVDQVRAIVTENGTTSKLERVKNNITGDNPMVLLNALDTYDINSFDVDFDFLIGLAQERVDDLLKYEERYNDKERIRSRKSYGMKG